MSPSQVQRVAAHVRHLGSATGGLQDVIATAQQVAKRGVNVASEIGAPEIAASLQSAQKHLDHAAGSLKEFSLDARGFADFLAQGGSGGSAFHRAGAQGARRQERRDERRLFLRQLPKALFSREGLAQWAPTAAGQGVRFLVSMKNPGAAETAGYATEQGVDGFFKLFDSGAVDYTVAAVQGHVHHPPKERSNDEQRD